MPFSIRPFPVSFRNSCWPTFRVMGQLTASGLQRANIAELSRPVLYWLTPVLIAPRIRFPGVKLRWLSYLLRFLLHLSVTDSSVSAAPIPEFL
jgi:hypothetical protein